MESELPVRLEEINEERIVARELTNAYEEKAAFYRDQFGLTESEADERAREGDFTLEEAARDSARIRQSAPEHVTWLDLQRLAERDSKAMLEVWEGLKVAARDELESGHRAAQVLDWQRRPWARARYLAIRDSFREGSPPTTGVEAALIDLAAEAHGDYLELSEQLHRMLSAEAEITRDDLERDGRWRPSHEVTDAAIERVERRADRAHKHFLQTVKMVHDLQRTSSTLYVGHAGQINVGQQQVNLTRSSSDIGAQTIYRND